MAYKRISPMPIIEGGTNSKSFSTTDGVIYYDGTKLTNTSAGSSTQVLTSNGSGSAPTFQAGAGSTVTILGVGSPIAGVSTGHATQLSQTAGIRWLAIFARTQTSSQAVTQTLTPLAGTVSTMYVYVASNSSTTTTTITMNKNSANTTLVVTIPALTTGIFTDLVHSVSFSQGDLMQFECSQATTGNVEGSISAVFI